MAKRSHKGKRRRTALLRGLEAVFLIGVLVCAGFLIRGVGSDMREQSRDQQAREQIQIITDSTEEDEAPAADAQEEAAPALPEPEFESAPTEEAPIADETPAADAQEEAMPVFSEPESESAQAQEVPIISFDQQPVETMPVALMEAAHAAGPEVVGVLEAGNEIALYVAQGSDNDYYLTHDVSGSYSSAGAAFLDYRCQLFPRSAHLMIHGHNMRSGAIFGKLESYGDASYLSENPLFYWTTEGGRDTYVPYAIAEISVDKQDAHYFKMTHFNFETDADFEAFTGGLQARTLLQLPIDVRPGDELLSLVTCSYDYSNGRLIIALRKVREDEDASYLAQQIQSAMQQQIETQA